MIAAGPEKTVSDTDRTAAKAFMAFQLRQHDEELWEKFDALQGDGSSLELRDIPFPNPRGFKNMELKKADWKHLSQKLTARWDPKGFIDRFGSQLGKEDARVATQRCEEVSALVAAEFTG